MDGVIVAQTAYLQVMSGKGQLLIHTHSNSPEDGARRSVPYWELLHNWQHP